MEGIPKIAVALVLLTAACGDASGFRSDGVGAGGSVGAEDAIASGGHEPMDAGLGAGGASTPDASGQGGANTSGGAGGSSAGGSVAGCDYILACASVGGPCSEALITTCGNVSHSSFYCGHSDEVQGYRFGDGTTFLCAPGAVPDCVAAWEQASTYCVGLTSPGTGGASGSGGSGGAPSGGSGDYSTGGSPATGGRPSTGGAPGAGGAPTAEVIWSGTHTTDVTLWQGHGATKSTHTLRLTTVDPVESLCETAEDLWIESGYSGTATFPIPDDCYSISSNEEARLSVSVTLYGANDAYIAGSSRSDGAWKLSPGTFATYNLTARRTIRTFEIGADVIKIDETWTLLGVPK